MLGGGARYYAELVPGDDQIARMYETAIERLVRAGLSQYEISNFAVNGRASRHNLRYWKRRPYLGLGLDASSMLRAIPHEADRADEACVLRSKTTDDLKDYLDEPESSETAWLSPARQHEEAWFLGLRLNEGVDVEALRNEFGAEPVAKALHTATELVETGLLTSEGDTVRLTARGRLLSNEVFQEFLEATLEDCSTAETTAAG
jgi:oxygen-independent coproporphyrinogen-3 oxidase